MRNLEVGETCKELAMQMRIKGHPSHDVITGLKFYVSLWGNSPRATSLAENLHMTYEQLKEAHPREFEEHLNVLQDCVKAGFLI